jgi:pentatricopeptide repeat protein
MTNMIQGYVEISNLPKAMQTFQHCVSRGIKPDRAAYKFLITGFMDYDRIDDAVVCLQHMRKANLNPTKDTWNMLLDACVRKQQWSTGALLVKEIDASGFAITNPALRRNYLRLKNSS